MGPSESTNPLEERHYTIAELAKMWNFSTEFVRQIVRGEPGVTEWVRQQPGRRRYSVLRVPQSVAARVYRRALTRADGVALPPRSVARRYEAATTVSSHGRSHRSGSLSRGRPRASKPANIPN